MKKNISVTAKDLADVRDPSRAWLIVATSGAGTYLGIGDQNHAGDVEFELAYDFVSQVQIGKNNEGQSVIQPQRGAYPLGCYGGLTKICVTPATITRVADMSDKDREGIAELINIAEKMRESIVAGQSGIQLASAADVNRMVGAVRH